MNEFITIFGYILTPLAGVVTWLVSRKKQRNDFLRDMQASIDLLASENKKLMEEVIALRNENMQLKAEVEELSRKLDNVKTITRTK